MQEIKEIIKLLDEAIKEDSDSLITWWNIIKDWYNKEVDEYRSFIDNWKKWLLDYQNKLIKETWISNLKIKYTQASWYFIEVLKAQTSKVPDYFVHRQTLVWASRYISSDLKEFEQKILEWESKMVELEYELFLDLREKVLDNFACIKQISKNISFIDFSSSLSFVAYKNNYSKPEIKDGYDLTIKSWRHPIIETIETDFITNDLAMTKKSYVNIITWPNMWWKSTYLRQNALIILMSHIWSFVPAKEAFIPLTDKIFSRVWASDNLFLWQSTFMVEMQEVANILNNSSKSSFVIIDEIWRWTSTYDGMSLAWAILKHNHDNIKSKTLFATHYHELVDESKILPWVSNFSVAVWENDDNIVFLRKIIPGSIKKSYWIEVARLAWISPNVIKEAKTMLKILEDEHSSSFKQLSFWAIQKDTQIKIIKEKSKIEEYIQDINLDNITPIQALQKLIEFKEALKKSEK